MKRINISWVPDFQNFYYYHDYLTNILNTISNTIQGNQNLIIQKKQVKSIEY